MSRVDRANRARIVQQRQENRMPYRLSDQERIWRSVPESQVLHAVIDYLQGLGAFAWRVNTGAAKAEHNGKSRFIRFAEPGTADVFCLYRGRFIAIETKTELGKQSEWQCRWQRAIECAGGTYLLVRPSTWQSVIDGALAAPGGR